MSAALPHADLNRAILAAIAKSHAQAPFRVDALPDLVGVPMARIMGAIEALFQARVLSYAVITRQGETYTVAWPTGVKPKPVGSRAYIINSHTQADAAAKAIRPRTGPGASTKTLHGRDWSVAEIGQELGRAKSSVLYRLKKLSQAGAGGQPREETAKRKYSLRGTSDTHRPHNCLCCGRKFNSEGPHNRMCSSCRSISVAQYELYL